MAEIRIGCSGWSYADWGGGLVYPEGLPRTRWFEHYTTRFDTVELNTTFYRLPRPETMEAWERRAPEGFVYAVKVGQFGTHRKKLKDAATWLPNHLDRVDRLGRSLGPNLVQLPPRWRLDLGRLEEFFEAAPAGYRWAVELRDPSWLDDRVYELLARHRAALCLHDLLPDQPFVLTTDWTYVRFHGPDAVRRPYHGAYSGRRLWRVADQLGRWIADGVDVYAYFNNDVGGAAVGDATWLRDRLVQRAAA